MEEKTRYKLPNIASELITCDVPQVRTDWLSAVPVLHILMVVFVIKNRCYGSELSEIRVLDLYLCFGKKKI